MSTYHESLSEDYIRALDLTPVPAAARATTIAYSGDWAIRSYGGQMFDATLPGTPAITPAFPTLAELAEWLDNGNDWTPREG